jgi:hypothetical protein
MKKFFSIALMGLGLMTAATAQAQGEKPKRPSPAASVSQTLPSGATVSIQYSQPSLKGRAIGKDVEPKTGVLWRAGANEATVFETDRDIQVEGKNCRRASMPSL